MNAPRHAALTICVTAAIVPNLGGGTLVMQWFSGYWMILIISLKLLPIEH